MTELCRSTGDSLSVGRAYDNNLVVSDPYIAPNQLSFRRINGLWEMDILDHTNPVLLNGEIVEKTAKLKSGDKLTVGRTHLSLFSDLHEVEKTRKLPLSGWTHHGLKALMISIFVLFLVCLFDIIMGYFEQSTNFDLKENGYSMLILALVIFAWAGFWAIAGRLFTHQHHFSVQLLVSALAVAVYIFFTPIADYLEYINNSHLVGRLVSYTVIFLILSMLFKLNLFYATHIKKSTMASVIFTSFLLIFIYAKDELQKEDLETKPQYSSILKPPFAQMNDGQTIDDFFNGVDKEIALLQQDIDEE